MENNRKEQERAELYRTIQNMANDLCSSVSGWDFKQYVLSILFYRYISENDPACGSGSLLLKFAKILGKENVRQGFFGQEINITAYNLCRINMFLHDIEYQLRT